MPRSHEGIHKDVQWGVRRGLAIASVYCVWVIGIYLISGAAAFEKQGTTLPRVLFLYATIGTVAGAIVGLLRPATRGKFGAYLVGWIVGVLIVTGIGISLEGLPQDWDFAVWLSIPVLSPLAGWVVGSELWKSTERDSGERR